MSLQSFFEGPKGKAIAVTVLLAGIAGLAWQIKGGCGSPSEVKLANSPVFVCAECQNIFNQELKAGMSIPLECPKCHQVRAFRGEPCYWTKEGPAQEKAVWVLLNKYANKPEPTFCPDCGRLVRERNPGPGDGINPPMLESDYRARRDD